MRTAFGLLVGGVLASVLLTLAASSARPTVAAIGEWFRPEVVATIPVTIAVSWAGVCLFVLAAILVLGFGLVGKSRR